jgi:hypothetical protein
VVNTAMQRLFCVGFAAVLAGMTATVGFAQLPGTISLPDAVTTGCLLPPVSISTTEAGGTLGYDFEISFDSNVLVVESVALGSLTNGSMVEECEFAYNDGTPGTLAISIACTEGAFGAGTIASIQFEPRGVAGSSALTFEMCSLDEVDCTTDDGSVDVSGCPAINLGITTGSGTYGLSPGRVCLGASLASNALAVASASTTVTFDPTKFTLLGCSINPTLTGIGKAVTITAPPPGVGMQEISVSGGATAIPSGNLFICTFAIAAGVAEGTYDLTNTAASADGSGTPVPTAGLDGLLGVTTCGGDCNGNGGVDIGEVVKVLNIAGAGGVPLCIASNPPASCPAGDRDNSGSIGINEVVLSLNHAGAGGVCP